MTPLDSALDLNLLRPLMALLHERHVSRAAAAASVTQPAMSRSLARLRASLGDELLVRTGQSYELTPRAERLMLRLGELIPELHSALQEEPFVPQPGRRYRVAGGDPIATVLAPTLHRALREDASDSSLHFGPEPERIEDELARGLSDIVLSPEPPVSDLCAEPVLRARWVCVVDAQHPFAKLDRVDLESWMAAAHIDIAGRHRDLVSVAGRSTRSVNQRQVRLIAPDHTTALASVVGTDLVATLAEPFVRCVGVPSQLRMIGAPSEIEPVEWLAVWHRRNDRDPALERLRVRVREALSTAGR